MMRRAAFFLVFGLLAGVFTLAFGGLAHGCSPYFRSTYVPYTAPTYVEHRVVIDPIYVAQFVPIPVATVGYVPPAVASLPPAAGGTAPTGTAPAGVAATTERVGSSGQAIPTAAVSPCEAELRKVKADMEELKGLFKQLASAQAGASGGAVAREVAPAPAPAAAPAPALSILSTRCLVCHGKTADTDAAKGGKVFRFSDNGVSLRADAPVLDMLRQSRDGTMPKQDKKHNVAALTDSEYSQLEEELLAKKEAKP